MLLVLSSWGTAAAARAVDRAAAAAGNTGVAAAEETGAAGSTGPKRTEEAYPDDQLTGEELTGEEALDPIFRTRPQPASQPANGGARPGPRKRAADSVEATADARLTSDPEFARLEQQIRFEEFEPVLRETEVQIDVLERERGRYAPELIEPLLLNGDALVGLERYSEALEQYGRAVHVQRVNSGLYAPEQVTAVYREANVLKLVGDLNQANDREEYAFSVLRRTYGAASPELLPGLYHLAQWYDQTSNPYLSRDLYRRAVNIIENAYGADSPMLVKPLDGIARSFFRERFPPFYSADGDAPLTPIGQPSDDPIRYYDSGRPLTVGNYSAGERALERIVLLRSQQPNATGQERSEAFLKLADWHLLFEKHREAHRLYLEAIAVLAEESPAEAEALMREPVLLHFPRPNSPRPPPPRLRGDKRTGFVELEFDLSQRGTITRIRGMDSNPPGLMDFKVRKSLRAARYRPAMLDGDLAPMSQHRYRYEFSYYETIREADLESVPETPSDDGDPTAAVPPDGPPVSANSATPDQSAWVPAPGAGASSAGDEVSDDV
ncbi:MAG: energy transducer TonB [Pseudomonadota bacterium]